MSKIFVCRIMFQKQKLKREYILPRTQEVDVVEVYLMEINNTIELFGFVPFVQNSIIGCTTVNSLVMITLRLILNHSLITVDLFVAFFPCVCMRVYVFVLQSP